MDARPRRPFRNRTDASRLLASKLMTYAGRPDVLVLALPRGGVPVAYEVASALDAPLDVFLVRKLGVPGYEELAMGAIASGGVRVLNEEVVRSLYIPPHIIDRVAEVEGRKLARRSRRSPFHAVGLWYDDFTQTTDDEVRALLARRTREYDGSPR